MDHAYKTLLKCIWDATLRRSGGPGTLAVTATWLFDYKDSAIIVTKNALGGLLAQEKFVIVFYFSYAYKVPFECSSIQ